MSKPTPDRLSPTQAQAALEAIEWAISRNPEMARRMLDLWDPLTEARDRLRGRCRMAEAAE
jgi:hypothetical protein